MIRANVLLLQMQMLRLMSAKCRLLGTHVPPPWLPRLGSSPWNRGVIVDPHVAFAETPVVRKYKPLATKAVQEKDFTAFADAALGFLQDCSKLSLDDPLWISNFLLYIDGKSPIRAPLWDCWDMVHSTASYAAAITEDGNNRSGFALAGDKGVGKTQLLQFCAVVPSILLDNVVGVYFDANSSAAKEYRLTPTMLVREALRRRLTQRAAHLRKPHVIEQALKNNCPVDGLVAAASENGLAIVVCVDEARATYHPDSPTHATWNELHDFLQSFKACAFVADSTTALPTLVRGTDSDVIKKDLDFPVVQTSLNGDKMAVIPVDSMHTREQYAEFLQGRCKNAKDIDLGDLHLKTSGRYRSIKQYLSGQRSVAFDEDLNVPSVGELGYSLLGHMLVLLRLEKHAARTDPFAERWFPASSIMRWMQLHNKHHGTSLGYAAVVSLVEKFILRQRLRRADTQDPEYTFGSPRQLYRLLSMIPSVFISFAWTDSIDIIAPVVKQFQAMNSITTIICTAPAAAAVISSIGIERFEHDQAIGVLDEENAFMLLVLTKAFSKRLDHPCSGVSREVAHAVELVKKGAGSKVLFASDNPSSAWDDVVPKLPTELQELVKSSLIFDTADVRGLAERMSGRLSSNTGDAHA